MWIFGISKEDIWRVARINTGKYDSGILLEACSLFGATPKRHTPQFFVPSTKHMQRKVGMMRGTRYDG